MGKLEKTIQDMKDAKKTRSGGLTISEIAELLIGLRDDLTTNFTKMQNQITEIQL